MGQERGPKMVPGAIYKQTFADGHTEFCVLHPVVVHKDGTVVGRLWRWDFKPETFDSTDPLWAKWELFDGEMPEPSSKVVLPKKKAPSAQV